jgi:hypothetical protein
MQSTKQKCLFKDSSHLLGIRTAPAWPPFPSNSTFRLAGAAMAVTMPIDMPESRNKRHIMIIEV